jgi:hypothetical protein
MDYQTQLISRAVDRAKAMLAQTSCASLFNADGVDPAVVLDDLKSGVAYGHIVFGDPGTFAKEDNYLSIYATTGPIVGDDGGNGGQIIDLNPFVGGAFYRAGEAEQARALLHELGHVYYNTFGATSTPIKPDNKIVDRDGIQEEKNKSLIRDNCP